MPANTRLDDNSWEHAQTNLLNRTRDSRQACKKLRNMYEARAFLENDYGQRMLQLAKTMDTADVETGAVGVSLFALQKDLSKTADFHLSLAKDIKERATDPLERVLDMQTRFKKDLEANIKNGLYHKLKLMVEYVLNASERYNTELEETDKRPHTYTRDGKPIYKSSEKRKLDTLLGNYESAMSELKTVVADWNSQWHSICEEFENLEKTRITLFKLNLTQYADLFNGTLELERESHNLVSHSAEKIDVARYLDQFVKSQITSSKEPSAMDYIRLHAYQIQKRNSPDDDTTKDTHESPVPQKAAQPPSPLPAQSERMSTSLENTAPADEPASTFVISRVKIYGSDEEDEDEEEPAEEDDYYVVDGSQDVYSVGGESAYSQPNAEAQSERGSSQHNARIQDPVMEAQDGSNRTDSYQTYQNSFDHRQGNHATSATSNPVHCAEERERVKSFSNRKPVPAIQGQPQEPLKASNKGSDVPPYEPAPQARQQRERPGFPLYDDPVTSGSKARTKEPVQEELDDMLRELEHQDYKGSLARSSSRIRVGGYRPQKSPSSRRQPVQRGDMSSSSTAPDENKKDSVEPPSPYHASPPHSRPSSSSSIAPSGTMTFREKLMADRRMSAREAQSVMQKKADESLPKKEMAPAAERVDQNERERSVTPTASANDYRTSASQGDPYETKRSIAPTQHQHEYHPSMDSFEKKRSVTPTRTQEEYKRSVTPTRIEEEHEPSVDRYEINRSATPIQSAHDYDYEPDMKHFDKKDTASAEPQYIDEVKTLYPYVADDEGELSFVDDEILKISEKREGGWWLAHDPSDASRQGLIPSNFVESLLYPESSQ